MPTAKSTRLSKPTKEEANRLWESMVHREDLLNNRLNFFLLLESVLLGIVAMLFGQKASATNLVFVLRAFLFLGLALTVIWAYVAAQQKYYFDSIYKLLQEILPEYGEYIRLRERVHWPVASLVLLSYVVPMLFIVIWIVLLFAA